MSRIGRKPIPVPAGVKIALQGGQVDVQGPKGKLTVPLPRGITFEQKDGVLTALRETEEHRALHGLARALVANAVHGVTQGFKKDLDIVGVGYRAELKGKIVAFALGKSHPIEFQFEGIRSPWISRRTSWSAARTKAKSDKIAADLRALRPPDPYSKGVRITGERLKKGRQGGAAGGGLAHFEFVGHGTP